MPEAWGYECPSCGQEFVWRAAHAGRKLTCRCGQVLSVPAQPDPGTYELESDAASGHTPPQPASAPARVLPYQQQGVRYATPIEVLGMERIRDLYLPIVTISLSVVTLALREAVTSGAPSPLADAIKYLGVLVVWKVSVLMLAIVVASKLLDVGFGFVPLAVLKVGAIALGPLAVWSAIGWTFGGAPSAEVVGWMFSIPVYWGLFSYLFELDFRETLICVVLTTLLNWLAFMVIRVWLGW